MAGILALNSRSEVLLMQDILGRWKIPSGGIEKGESCLEAAKREFTEETGCTPKSIYGLLSITEFNKSKGDFYSFIFIGAVDESEAQDKLKMTPEEVLDVRYFSKKEIQKMQPPTIRSKLIKETILQSFNYKRTKYPIIFHRHSNN